MHSEMVIFGDTFSGGFVISRIAARLMPQFAMGPQKCVVLGPIGELMKPLTAVHVERDVLVLPAALDAAVAAAALALCPTV